METSQQHHDATTGFHDIESFSYISAKTGLSISTILIAIVTIAAIAFLLKKLSNKKTAVKTIPPIQISREKIAKLAAITSPTKQDLIELSLVLRYYLSQELQAACQEMTTSELQQKLPLLFSNRIQFGSSASQSNTKLHSIELKDQQEQIISTLNNFELKIFAPESEFDSNYFYRNCETVQKLINDISMKLSRIDQQSATIISQSKLQS